MAWVAMDRAVRDVQRQGLAGPAARWRSVRNAIHRDVCNRGFDHRRGVFVQRYGSTELDASLLLMPIVGFLKPHDKRVRATVEAIERDLMVGGFVRRYRTEETPDGLPAGEGEFLPCSFWLADALTLIGRKRDAQRIYERLLALRNDVGLLSEEYDPRSRRMLGNFPQALTHVALVNTARNLARAGGPAEHRSGVHEHPPQSQPRHPRDRDEAEPSVPESPRAHVQPAHLDTAVAGSQRVKRKRR
jgi:GH15 family glucan-1,4-alpha-glucosidase